MHLLGVSGAFFRIRYALVDIHFKFLVSSCQMFSGSISLQRGGYMGMAVEHKGRGHISAMRASVLFIGVQSICNAVLTPKNIRAAGGENRNRHGIWKRIGEI